METSSWNRFNGDDGGGSDPGDGNGNFTATATCACASAGDYFAATVASAIRSIANGLDSIGASFTNGLASVLVSDNASQALSGVGQTGVAYAQVLPAVLTDGASVAAESAIAAESTTTALAEATTNTVLAATESREGAAAASAAETTNLFRAVTPPELESIQSLNAFTNSAGIEVKYFSTSLEGAQSYASQATSAFGDGPFSFVKTSIPTSSITP